jgi:hypothetical protein
MIDVRLIPYDFLIPREHAFLASRPSLVVAGSLKSDIGTYMNRR